MFYLILLGNLLVPVAIAIFVIKAIRKKATQGKPILATPKRTIIICARSILAAIAFAAAVFTFLSGSEFPEIKTTEPNQRLQTMPRRFPLQLLKSLARHV